MSRVHFLCGGREIRKHIVDFEFLFIVAMVRSSEGIITDRSSSAWELVSREKSQREIAHTHETWAETEWKRGSFDKAQAWQMQTSYSSKLFYDHHGV